MILFVQTSNDYIRTVEWYMLDASGRVFVDDGVTAGILNIIRTATDQIILVSPYNKL